MKRDLNDVAHRPAAVFLDRDGTLNRQVGYINDPVRMELLPGAAKAVERINAMGFLAIVITNQSAVARGLATEAQVQRVNAEVALRIAQETRGRIDAFYYCPHHESEGSGPYTTDCQCRKPKPGMVLAAAREFNIDLERSWYVGDGLVDHQAAKAASPSIRTILLPSGFHEGAGHADFYCDSLGDAVALIAERTKPEGERRAQRRES